jgi:hypothetical protein
MKRGGIIIIVLGIMMRLMDDLFVRIRSGLGVGIPIYLFLKEFVPQGRNYSWYTFRYRWFL